jgi:stress response protein YsnF
VEAPEVLKRPFLREEIVVKKKTVTETKRIREQLRGERVSVEGAEYEEKVEEHNNALAE